jgi:hypothetical protein
MNSETLLLRQVSPSFFPDDYVSSQAFLPFPKDENLLSVYDGDMISAAAAHRHYTEVLQFQSVGVWAVTEGEACTESLSCRSDPLENSPSHAVIDFSGHSERASRKIAKRLRDKALTRGRLHP